MPFPKISRLIDAHGFPHHGFAPLGRPLTMDYYAAWIARGDHADMDYLAEHAAWKEDPRRWRPTANSAIVIALPYLPHPYPSQPRHARIASYARGRDYHHRYLADLERIAAALRLDFPREEFLCFTDAAPILERDLAHRAGLGWFGKNTVLIDQTRGSFFLIGQILTTLRFDADAPTPPDLCGTCTRCLDACPTGALEGPRRLNARKCISYWTIEAKAPAPVGLRERFGDWFFGCDVCQAVCPWNQKAHGATTLARLAEAPPRADLVEELRRVLRATNRGLLREVHGTPLTRARPATLKRNALVVIANQGLVELTPEVEAARGASDLAEVADWALTRLRSAPAPASDDAARGARDPAER